MNFSREFQVFVKPVGANCNLRCEYCYYIDKLKMQNGSDQKIMEDSLLEKYITQLAEATTEKNIFFAWHGGEPTLSGLDFFRKAVSLQKELIGPDKNIINGIQTNATLLDEEWCRFFADENFFVGVSIDGPQKFHDRFRTSGNNKGSFTKVIDGYSLLRKYNVRTEILTVVSSANAGHPSEVYDFLISLGSEYITFLPFVKRSSSTQSGVTIDSVNAAAFGTFLISVFDKWISVDIGKIKIQIIEEALRTAFKQDHTVCIFKKTCGGVPVVERNGDFFSCDHFVDNEHHVGNINEISISDLLDSSSQISFGQAKKNTLPQYCLDCEVLDMCNGECPKNRFLFTPDGETGLNYLCEGYKFFFNHIRPFAEAIAEAWSKG